MSQSPTSKKKNFCKWQISDLLFLLFFANIFFVANVVFYRFLKIRFPVTKSLQIIKKNFQFIFINFPWLPDFRKGMQLIFKMNDLKSGKLFVAKY